MKRFGWRMTAAVAGVLISASAANSIADERGIAKGGGPGPGIAERGGHGPGVAERGRPGPGIAERGGGRGPGAGVRDGGIAVEGGHRGGNPGHWGGGPVRGWPSYGVGIRAVPSYPIWRGPVVVVNPPRPYGHWENQTRREWVDGWWMTRTTPWGRERVWNPGYWNEVIVRVWVDSGTYEVDDW